MVPRVVHAAVATWFVTISAHWLAISGHSLVGLDTRTYLGATRVWLAGGDPWAVSFDRLYFGAPPPTLLVMTPFALLPAGIGEAVLFVVGLLAAVATVRFCHLPWYWLAFPPLVITAVVGNPGTWLLPLMLWRGRPLAIIAKVYATVPLVLLGRWRTVAAASILILVTAPFLAWDRYLGQTDAITAHLADQLTIASFSGPMWLALPLLALLWLLDREQAAWLALPAVWPISQWNYAHLAMPAGTLAAVILAVPVPGTPVVAVGACLAWAAVRAWARAPRSRYQKGEAGAPPPPRRSWSRWPHRPAVPR